MFTAIYFDTKLVKYSIDYNNIYHFSLEPHLM